MSATKKQTAVEWLFEQVVNFYWKNLQCEINIEIFKQAKAMEKEQIVDAVDGFPLDKRHLNGEEYYNETYEKE